MELRWAGNASVIAAVACAPSGKVFLASWDEPASLVGRHFRPISAAATEPLWAVEEERPCSLFANRQ